MGQTDDFFRQAQAVIEAIVRGRRDELLAAHGNIDIDIKKDNSIVTELDKSLERELREALLSFDSNIGIEGEELGVEGNRETFWLVDPIDGTESFVRGLPFVRNMVTLIDGGEPVFAFVYKPITDELYIATKGNGAFKNGKAIHVSNRPIERAWLELSSPMADTETFEALSAVRQKISGYRTIGEFLYVAEGKVDGQLIFKAGGGVWDYAPRALLIAEAGGRVANLGSDTYDYRDKNVLATNPLIFDDIKKTIDALIKQ